MVYENFTTRARCEPHRTARTLPVRRPAMERVVFERMAELDQEHWWFVGRRRILANLIERVAGPPHGARVLEVGCGTGHNLAMLAKFGTVDACELDASARELASLRLGRPVFEAKLPDLSMFKQE